MKRIFLLSFLVCAALMADAQHTSRHNRHASHPISTEARQQLDHWVDSVMNKLSLEEQVAQLMVLRVPLNMNAKQQKAFEKLITQHKVGGVCFFAGTSSRQLELTRRFQHVAATPLMVCLDAEWGLGMRLTDAYSFPQMMMMGALPTSSDTLIYRMASEIGLQCRNLGVHVNFAPVVDLNSNPANPVIGARSFGENPYLVAHKGLMYMRGLQSQKVMACAKHFPGHGDTDVDSHLDLPVINHSRAYIDTVDSYPFRQLIQGGVKSVMAAHLQVNALDSRENRPSSLSSLIINNYLRKEIGFKGLVFTDGIDMKAIAKHYGNGDEALQALLAGCDIILLPQDVETCIKVVSDYAKQHPDFDTIIQQKCRLVLREKYKCGLAHLSTETLRTPNAADNNRCNELTSAIAGQSVTLITDSLNLLPLQRTDSLLEVTLGNSSEAMTLISEAMASRVRRASKVLVSLHANANPTSQRDYGVSDATLALLGQLMQLNPNIVLVIYGSPYILNHMARKGAPLPNAVVMAYQNNRAIRQGVEPVLFGKAPFVGHLPVAVTGYPAGHAYQPVHTKPVDPYARLRAQGIDIAYFKQIDSIAQLGIEQQAYPGCQILVARRGEVLYNRSYGRQTYDRHSPLVDSTTLYDLASLTKVTATTFAIMKLVDSKKISLDDPLSRYLPYLKRTNKSRITVRQVLSHQARLKAFDAYWKKVDPACADLSLGYVEEENCARCRSLVLLQAANSELIKENKYLYSDLGFMLLSDLVRQVSGQTLDVFMEQQFYKPMGLTSTTFSPRLHGIDTARCAPTEVDDYFRHRELRGEVHDQNAAAMGGVSGHAGLFSTATDLAKLYQMMLNGGVYNGRRYLSQEVINTFNHQYYSAKGNRRALGYDKPLSHPRKGGNTAPEVSQSSYGHTGFTGTMVWADPDRDIIYIFLSNRTYPDSHAQNKLANLDIRTDIQSLIYQALPNTSTPAAQSQKAAKK